MFLKSIKIFLLAILLFLCLTTYAFIRGNEVFAQTLTSEQQELLDKSMEETEILQEQALKEAQEEVEENMDEVQKSIEESREEFEDEFEDAFENMPMPEPEFDIRPSLGGLLGGALLTTSAVIFFVLFIILIALGGLILNIVMLIDCSNREFNDKSLWMAVLIAGMLMGWGIIPGVLYYFLVKKKLGPIVKKEESK